MQTRVRSSTLAVIGWYGKVLGQAVNALPYQWLEDRQEIFGWQLLNQPFSRKRPKSLTNSYIFDCET